MANPENIAGQGFHTNPDRINRKGRPKGALSRSTLYRKWLEVADAEGLTEADKIVLAQITKAKTGDTPAAKEALDSGFGKVPDKMELDAIVENNVNLASKILAATPTEALEAALAGQSDNYEG